ncbi:hypothetical protein ACHAW5_003059 [Stephanodiscus triporus]|uniref:Uncharacterized protein n=1 Tax=Stephanodiscus triporus TaxID=2934178 RepID=A0ABD3NTI9_9STRA
MLLSNPSHRPKPRQIWWRGWAASIFIFAFLVICVKPPSDDDYASTSYTTTSSSTPAFASAEGDVLVRCVLVTPFEDDGKIAAKGTLEIAVHRGLAPLASDAFLHLNLIYLFLVVPFEPSFRSLHESSSSKSGLGVLRFRTTPDAS